MPTASERRPNIKEVVPFLRVADMSTSIHFYVEGLEARIAVRWEPEGELRQRAAANQLGLGVSLAFQCADAVALYHEFRSRGVEATEPVVGNGL